MTSQEQEMTKAAIKYQLTHGLSGHVHFRAGWEAARQYYKALAWLPEPQQPLRCEHHGLDGHEEFEDDTK